MPRGAEVVEAHHLRHAGEHRVGGSAVRAERHEQELRERDRLGVPAGGPRVFVEHRRAPAVLGEVELHGVVEVELPDAPARGGNQVHDVGVLGRDAEQRGPRTAEHDRWPRLLHGLRLGIEPPQAVVLAREVDHRLGPEPRDDLERLAELRDARLGRRIVEAERVVLLAEPARAQAELEPPAAHVIDGGRDLRGERRMPEGVAGDELRQPHAARRHRHRGERREAVETRILGRLHRAPHEEVILERDGVVADRLGALRPLPHLGEAPLRENDREAGPHRSRRGRRGAATGLGAVTPAEAWSIR